jgi:phage terminase small subunit
MPKTRRYLSKREDAFVTAYVRCGNGTQAAKEAGYSGKDDTLARIARANLKKSRIREAIKAMRQEIEDREAKILSLVRGKEWLTRVVLGEEKTVVDGPEGPSVRPFSDASRVNAFKALSETMGWKVEQVKMKHSGKVGVEGEVTARVEVVVPAKLTREEWDKLWGKKEEEPKKEKEKENPK